MQEVETLSRVRLGPGSLDGTIRRMLADGWIAESEGPGETADKRRRDYRLAQPGQRVLRAQAARLARLVAIAHAMRLLPGVGRSVPQWGGGHRSVLLTSGPRLRR